MTMDYCNGDETSPSQRSYSVLRSKFDAWLMEQAEEAGAQLITGIRVDNLVQRDGKVVGVEADGDVIEAKTVILADGVNSILAEKLGMAKRVKPTDVAVGVKELIELPKSVIEDRFQLQGNQGAACLFAGSPTDGLMGGGFLYTNENTLSLGLVCGLHHLHDAKIGAANAGRFQTTSGRCTADRGRQAGGIFRSRSAGSRHQHAAGAGR